MQISYHGHEKEAAKEVLSRIPDLTQMTEPEARLKIQDAIDEHNLKSEVCVNGNTVWSKKKILRNLDRIMKHGTLYYRVKPRYALIGNILKIPVGGKTVLSKYFYKFLSLTCGSIAHYDIHGWILQYPTVDHLKKFFMRNEFGKRVLDDIPWRMSDVRRIVEEIERKLFPFKTYMKTKQLPFLGVKNANHKKQIQHRAV